MYFHRTSVCKRSCVSRMYLFSLPFDGHQVLKRKIPLYLMSMTVEEGGSRKKSKLCINSSKGPYFGSQVLTTNQKQQNIKKRKQLESRKNYVF